MTVGCGTRCGLNVSPPSPLATCFSTPHAPPFALEPPSHQNTCSSLPAAMTVGNVALTSCALSCRGIVNETPPSWLTLTNSGPALNCAARATHAATTLFADAAAATSVATLVPPSVGPRIGNASVDGGRSMVMLGGSAGSALADKTGSF